MSLTHRPAIATDLRRCLSILSDAHAYDISEERALVAFWESLLTRKVALSWVVEERSLPTAKRIVGFGLAVFVTDQLNGEIKTTWAPHIGRKLFLDWRSGRARTTLRRDEIARDNTGDGLNLLVIAQGCTVAGRSEACTRLRARMFDAFSERLAGYTIKEIVQEVFSPEERGVALGLGWNHLRGDAAASSVLMGLQRDSCLFPSTLWKVFHADQPSFNFSEPEREMLEAALHGKTDDEISKALDVSVWTIRKRWQKVYEKVDRVIADLLQPGSDEAAMNGDAAVGQRRRHLLDYLRQCPEEIRPRHAPSRRQRWAIPASARPKRPMPTGGVLEAAGVDDA